VRLRRTLAASRPDAFTPDLAMSLNNLASFLSDLGRREEALAAAEEAVRLRRTLAASRPDAFTPDLARSLNNLGGFLSDLGRRQEALAAAEDAVRLYRMLAGSRPDAFTPNLAGSLSVLGDKLEGLDRLAEAVHNDEDSVCLLAPYFMRSPRAFAGAIVSYMQDYMRRCELAGQEPDAELLTPIVEKLSTLSPRSEPPARERAQARIGRNPNQEAQAMDPVTLATAAVAVLAPYLAKAGEGAAKKLGEEAVDAGGKLLFWLRGKLGGRAQEALDDLKKEPGSEDNQADVRKQLKKALEADPALAAELQAMLPREATDAGAMTQDVSGAGAKAAQVRGSWNTTTIG
jgi:tetratricopeptide (TPR) repeat protein